MKKHLLTMAVLLAGASLFTACNDNDGETEYSVPVTKGALLVCSGNQSGNIDGALSYLDFSTAVVAPDQFKAVNGRSLGSTPNDVLVYGDKAYIAVTGENTVEVLDLKNMRTITTIKTPERLGEGCLKPRHLTAGDGKVFISFYGGSKNEYDANWNATTSGNGCVAAIDTVGFTKQNIYQVGSFPEGLTYNANNKKVYVANSDYAACTKASISIIDLASGAVTNFTNDAIVNPCKIATAGNGDMYILDNGNYNDRPSGVIYVSDGTKKAKMVAEATDMACLGTCVFTVNAPYGSDKISYEVYDVMSGSKQTYFNDQNSSIYSPACLGVDPVSGRLFIASYQKDPDTGKTGYKLPCKIYMLNVQYTTSGAFSTASKSDKVWGLEGGVGPCAFAFNVGRTIVKL